MLTVDMLNELEMLMRNYGNGVNHFHLSEDERDKYILAQRIVELEMELEATKWVVEKLRKEVATASSDRLLGNFKFIG